MDGLQNGSTRLAVWKEKEQPKALAAQSSYGMDVLVNREATFSIVLVGFKPGSRGSVREARIWCGQDES
ncbi:hypothetical protein MRX96_035944 [Rhipicephalus microplus]